MEIKFSCLQLGKFYPPVWGGIETVTHNLLVGLTELSVKNSAIVFGDSNSLERFWIGDNFAEIYRTKYFDCFHAPISISYLTILRKVAADYKVVVIHLPNPLAVIALALSGYRGTVVLYWHSDIINKGFLGKLMVPLERWLISRADVVLGPTDTHLRYSRYASLLLPKGKVSPYPVGSHLLKIAAARVDCPRRISKNGVIRLVAIGRLVEYKGLDYLIRAVPRLLARYSIQVDILGDGHLRLHLNALIEELCLQHHVFLHGSVSDDLKDKFLRESNIFCFPSVTKQEMYGMAQIEAMAHGLPIISTDIFGSGSPELTRMTGAGLVVSPRSDEEISQAIEQLIEDPFLYSRLSNAGLHAITHRFNSSVLVDAFCKICQ